MASGHLLEVLLLQTFDARISWRKSQGKIGFFEPGVQRFGVDPKHLSTGR